MSVDFFEKGGKSIAFNIDFCYFFVILQKIDFYEDTRYTPVFVYSTT